jgi:hypothetical protein
MRCSKKFNSRERRAVRDFCISHNSKEITLALIADRAANETAQAFRVRSGRKLFDSFEIEMTEDDARRLHAILHRKFFGTELLREAVRGVAEGFGHSLGEALLNPRNIGSQSPSIPERMKPAELPALEKVTP